MKQRLSNRQRKIRIKASRRREEIVNRPIIHDRADLEVVARIMDYGHVLTIAAQDSFGWRHGLRVVMGVKWRHAERIRDEMVAKLLKICPPRTSA